MQEKYYTLYQLKGSSTKQGLQMPTCNNLDQSRIHHLEKKNHILNIITKSCIPPPQKKNKNKNKKTQPTKQTNEQTNYSWSGIYNIEEARTKIHFSLFAL